MRGHAGEPEYVIGLATLTAPRQALRRRFFGREPATDPAAPAPVPTARATLVGARPFAGEDEARAWLGDADLEAAVAADVAALNRLLHLHRIAAADLGTREVRADQALVARVGVAPGEQALVGRWTAARELPRTTAPRRPRARARLEALLGGRDAALAAEELALRARLDLDRGRSREAALQLQVAHAAAVAELEAWAGRPEIAERRAALVAERPAVEDAAAAALCGGLDEARLAAVARILGLVEAALAARAAGGGD